MQHRKPDGEQRAGQEERDAQAEPRGEGRIPCNECGRLIPERSLRSGSARCAACREQRYDAGTFHRNSLPPSQPPPPLPDGRRMTDYQAMMEASKWPWNPEPVIDHRVDDSAEARRLMRPRTAPWRGGLTRRRGLKSRDLWKPVAPRTARAEAKRRAEALQKRLEARGAAQRGAEWAANYDDANSTTRQVEALRLVEGERLSLGKAGLRMGGITKQSVDGLIKRAHARGLTVFSEPTPTE